MEVDHNSIKSKENVFNKSLIKKGIIVFVGISVLTFLGLFLYNDGGKNVNLWQQMKPLYFILGLILMLADLYIGGLRNHIFFTENNASVKLMVSIKANLACLFMGSVTPSQTGGGPAQWYIWYKNGVPITDIIKASLFNFISTMIVLPVSGFFALKVLGNKASNETVMLFTKIGFGVFSTIFILLLVALFLPFVFDFLAKKISLSIQYLFPNRGKNIEEKMIKLVEELYKQRENYFNSIKNNPMLMVLSLLITVILYFNKYLLAYVLILGFGGEADFLTVIASIAVCYLLLYFSPSPGGSGIAEVSLAAMLGTFVSSEVANSVTLLHRSFLIFIPSILGAIVILDEMRKDN